MASAASKSKRRARRAAIRSEQAAELRHEQDGRAADRAYRVADAWARSPEGTSYGEVVRQIWASAEEGER